jgi:hypothetical protein
MIIKAIDNTGTVPFIGTSLQHRDYSSASAGGGKATGDKQFSQMTNNL